MPFHVRGSGDQWYIIQVDDLVQLFSKLGKSRQEEATHTEP